MQVISMACSQGLCTYLTHYLPPPTAAVVRCALNTWSTSFSCSLYMFPVYVLYTSPFYSLSLLSSCSLCSLSVIQSADPLVYLYSFPRFSLQSIPQNNLFCIRSLTCFNFWRPAVRGQLGFLGDIFSWLILIIFLFWFLSIWVCGDNRSRYWSLGLSCLGVNFIPELLFAVCIFREFWLSASIFPDLFGGYVQEGMLANVVRLKNWQAERYDLSHPPWDIVGERLSCLWCLYSVRDSCGNCMWDNK